MNLSHSRFLRGALSVSVLAVSAAAQSLFSQAEVLMAEGDPIPGIAGAINGGASALDFPVVDLNGNVLFRGRFTGPGITNLDDRAFFLGRSRDTLQKVVRAGDAEPSGTLGAGVVLITQSSATLQLPGINGSPRLSPEGGYILFGSGIIGPGVVTTVPTGTFGRNDSALFVGVPGAFQVLARRGTPTGVGGTNFETAFGGVSYQATSLNSQGTAAFQATLSGGDVSGTTNNFANFVGTPGNLSVVQRKGDLITIGGNQVRVDNIGFNVILNKVGMVLHDERLGAVVGTPPPTTANDGLLMLWYPGGLNVVLMREGDAAPVPTGAANYGSPTIAQGFGDAGGCAFGCTLSGGTVTTADDNANFVGGPLGFQLVWREGVTSPIVAGAVQGVANSTASYSDFEGGSIAFYGTLTDGGGGTITTANDQALWIGNGTNLRMIAREGDAAPGFANRAGFVSATFGSIAAGSVQMNARGQVTFSGAAVTLVDAANPAGAVVSCNYTWDPIKGLQLQFAQGDLIQTSLGGVAANSTGGVQFPSGDGTPLGMNNYGDIVQRANFTTGGAIVRTHIGSNQCTPSTISGTVGGVHTMQLDAGAANANQIYLVLCGGAGTRPGFSFGGSQIDLNIDPVWTDLAFNSLNTAPWAGTFGLLDGTGKASASFTCPPSIFIYAPQDLKHVLAVVDLNTLAVPFAGEPCSMLLY